MKGTNTYWVEKMLIYAIVWSTFAGYERAAGFGPAPLFSWGPGMYLPKRCF
jgi:hypothetical protein